MNAVFFTAFLHEIGICGKLGVSNPEAGRKRRLHLLIAGPLHVPNVCLPYEMRKLLL